MPNIFLLSLNHIYDFGQPYLVKQVMHIGTNPSPGIVCSCPFCRELNRIPNPWETKIREKTHAKEKQSHAQDSIYVVRQFAYIHGVAGISLLSGKNTEYNLAATIFFIYI